MTTCTVDGLHDLLGRGSMFQHQRLTELITHVFQVGINDSQGRDGDQGWIDGRVTPIIDLFLLIIQILVQEG